MQIIDLTDEHSDLFCQCLEDWSDEMKEAGNRKALWLGTMKNKGLIAKLSLDASGKVGGMIQAVPSEHAPIQVPGFYFISCIWVHGYKKGRGNFQKKGMGKALLQAVEKDVQSKGVKGLATWGISLPFWMKASWYKKQGYRRTDSLKGAVLLWKPFSDDAKAPKWIRPKKKPCKEDGKVVVTALNNGWCPGQNIAVERARRASGEFPDHVEFRVVNTLDRETYLEWGIMDGLFIDDKEVRTGPPPSYQKIRSKIARQVKRLT